MRHPARSAVAVATALLLAGCAGGSGSPVRSAVADVTRAANARDADGVRQRVDDLLRRVENDSTLNADDATRLMDAALAVQARADLIDADLIEQQQADEEAARQAAEEQAAREAEEAAAREAEQERLEEERQAAEAEQEQLEEERRAAEQAQAELEQERMQAEQEAEERSASPTPAPTRSRSPAPTRSRSPAPTRSPGPGRTPSPTATSTPAA